MTTPLKRFAVFVDHIESYTYYVDAVDAEQAKQVVMRGVPRKTVYHERSKEIVSEPFEVPVDEADRHDR